MGNSLDQDGRGPTDRQLLIGGIVVSLVIALTIGTLLLKSTGRLDKYVRVVADLVNVGDGLPKHSDVKYHGLLVGSVSDLIPATHGDPNFVHIDLKPRYAKDIPATVTARVVPSNVFAVSSVQLVDNGPGAGIKNGAHIPEDSNLSTVLFQTTISKLRDVLAAVGRGRNDHSLGILAAVGAAVLVLVPAAVGLWHWAPWRGGGDPLPAGAVKSIANTVPADIRQTGRLVIGVNVPYAPMEFKNADGQLVGFDIELIDAVSRVLGLVPDYRETAFDTILPSVQGGTLDVGVSSLTDTKEREALVDFVNYFQAGTQWAKRSGTAANPKSPCGLRVGVAQGTLQATEELPRKSDKCVAAGQPPLDIVVLFSQDEVTKALLAGEVGAMSADSPVTGFAIKLSRGELVSAGDVFDSAPYGWPVPKGSGLTESLRKALEHVIETSEYRTIATMWGVERGMLEESTINGAMK